MSVPFEIPDWLLDTSVSPAPPDTSAVDPHRVEDLVNDFIAAKQDALFTAPDAYYRTGGRDAVDGAPGILDRLNDLRTATLDAANDDGTRAMLAPRLDAHLDDARDGIDRHVVAQRDELTRQIIGERQRLIQRAATLEHNNDDKLAGLAEAHASAAQELARMNGEPGAEAMDAARSAIWRTAIDQRLANGNGPQAITLFDQVKNQLTPDDHLPLDGPMQVARNDQAANQWIANQTGTEGPPLQDRAAADPTLPADAKLIVRAKLDARDSAEESRRAAADQALDNQVADIPRILAATPDAYRPGTLARIAHGYDDVGALDKAAATRRLAMQEAVLVPFAQASIDRQQRQIDSFPDGELRDAAFAIQRQQADAAARAPGRNPEGAADPNVVPVADKPEDDPPDQTQQHPHVETPEGDAEHGHSVESMPPTVLGFPGLRPPPPPGPPKGEVRPPAAPTRPVSEKSPATPPITAQLERKLNTYLLEPSHPEGGPKARWFKEALGFTKDNMQDLGRQLVFDEGKATPTERTQWGQKFVQIIDLKGVNGRTIPTPTVWIKKPDGVVDFITAIPAKK